jgi:hypothetical protein
MVCYANIDWKDISTIEGKLNHSAIEKYVKLHKVYGFTFYVILPLAEIEFSVLAELFDTYGYFITAVGSE